MERSISIARHSRVNSSMTFSIFRVRPSAVVSNWKSIAQITFGRIGDIAPTCTPTPVRRFLRRRGETRSPSVRQSHRMCLLLTFHPALRAIFAARRHPHRGQSVENSRSQPRSSASSAVTGGGVSRCVERCGPTVRHARRSDTRTGRAASSLLLARGSGSKVSRRDLPQHVLVELGVREQSLQSSLLGLEFLEAFRIAGFHSAVLGEPPMPGRLGDLQASAHLGEFCAAGEGLLPSPSLRMI